MKVEVIVTPNFQREAKPLLKKYRSLRSELADLEGELRETPTLGIKVRENVYKIRLAVSSKGKGKSGGMRIITYVETELVQTPDSADVYLLSIYDKSDAENISDRLLSQLIEEIETESAEKPDNEASSPDDPSTHEYDP